MKAVDLIEKLGLFTEQWHPHLIAEGDSLQVFVARLEGEFIKHTHDNGDELFYVVDGEMEMCFPDRIVSVRKGQIILVPRGTEHCPRTVSGQEVHVLVVEPVGTKHTGNIEHERTVKEYPRI